MYILLILWNFYIELTDGNGPIRIDTQTVNIGERVEMECIVTGEYIVN